MVGAFEPPLRAAFEVRAIGAFEGSKEAIILLRMSSVTTPDGIPVEEDISVSAGDNGGKDATRPGEAGLIRGPWIKGEGGCCVSVQ